MVDFAFLAEKFETCPFWVVHDSIGDKAGKDGLHAFWGGVFEKYACDALQGSIVRPINVLYESPTFVDKVKGQVCDAIIVCDDAAALLEIKGSTFSSRAKYAADYTLLKNELDNKLVGNAEGAPKAVNQLRRSIELICNPEGPEPIEHVDLRRIHTLFPVVVTRDDIGSTLGVNAFLQTRFEANINRKKMQKTVTPLFCLNAEDLERLTAYLNDTPLTSLLEAHYRANRSYGKYFVNSYFSSADNQILKTRGLLQAERQAKTWRDFMMTAVNHLGLKPD